MIDHSVASWIALYLHRMGADRIPSAHLLKLAASHDDPKIGAVVIRKIVFASFTPTRVIATRLIQLPKWVAFCHRHMSEKTSFS